MGPCNRHEAEKELVVLNLTQCIVSSSLSDG